VVYAVQGEKNSRKIRFDLFNGGIQCEIDRNASVLISYKKADGHGGVYDVLDNGEKAFEFAYGSTNSVIITLAEQVLTTVGAVSLLVSFVLDDEILSTFNIVLDVSENPGIDVAESEDYFSLSAAIDAAKKVVGEMLDPNAFASKEYVDGVIGDLREDLDEISDDAKVFYVTISKSDDGSFAADKSVDVILSAYDNGRTVKAVVDDEGEQVTIPLIGIIEGDAVMYVGYGAYSNRIVISQTDILVSVHNDALPNVKTVNGTAPDENGNVELDIQSGGDGWTLLYNETTSEVVNSICATLDGSYTEFIVYLETAYDENVTKLLNLGINGAYVSEGNVNRNSVRQNIFHVITSPKNGFVKCDAAYQYAGFGNAAASIVGFARNVKFSDTVTIDAMTRGSAGTTGQIFAVGTTFTVWGRKS
jgi:uncharacterized protein (UPF0218 family)